MPGHLLCHDCPVQNGNLPGDQPSGFLSFGKDDGGLSADGQQHVKVRDNRFSASLIRFQIRGVIGQQESSLSGFKIFCIGEKFEPKSDDALVVEKFLEVCPELVPVKIGLGSEKDDGCPEESYKYTNGPYQSISQLKPYFWMVEQALSWSS